MAMHPITKHRPRTLRPCHCSARPPCRLSIVLPASFILAARLAGLREKRGRTGTTSGTFRLVTSLHHVTQLPTVRSYLPGPFLASCSSPVVLHATYIPLILLFHYSCMQLHIITTSPRKGPTRPAAPRELPPNHNHMYTCTLTFT